MIGVIDAKGASGGKAQGEREWTLRCSLDAWRVVGAPLERDEGVRATRFTKLEKSQQNDSTRPNCWNVSVGVRATRFTE